MHGLLCVKISLASDVFLNRQVVVFFSILMVFFVCRVNVMPAENQKDLRKKSEAITVSLKFIFKQDVLLPTHLRVPIL